MTSKLIILLNILLNENIYDMKMAYLAHILKKFDFVKPTTYQPLLLNNNC